MSFFIIFFLFPLIVFGQEKESKENGSILSLPSYLVSKNYTQECINCINAKCDPGSFERDCNFNPSCVQQKIDECANGKCNQECNNIPPPSPPNSNNTSNEAALIVLGVIGSLVICICLYWRCKRLCCRSRENVIEYQSQDIEGGNNYQRLQT